MRVNFLYLLLPAALLGGPAEAQSSGPEAALLSVERIWDRAGHNAFTDLVFFRNTWFCTFREGSGHIPGINGSVRVLASADGQNWRSAAHLSEAGLDLRDPKISVTPDGRLMLTIEGAYYSARQVTRREPRVAFSDKRGRRFSALQLVGLPPEVASNDDWLWRVSWHQGRGYGVMYQVGPEEWTTHLLTTADGINYEHITTFDLSGMPNETTLGFDEAGTMIALLRREGGDQSGVIGTSRPPYRSWQWQPLDRRLGGPNFVRLSDGTWICGTRDYQEQGHRTVLARVDTAGRFTPLLTLPSGGDTSYPGMVLRGGVLYVSYYSAHEGKASIYLARVLEAPLLLTEK